MASRHWQEYAVSSTAITRSAANVLQILEVCYKSGVHTVTIYAFSIENFKRSRYEVDALMEMAKIKLTQLSQHGELLDRYGARIRILGQRELLKPDVLEAMDRACDMTAHNHQTVLNVCFPYTSRDEMTTAIRRTVQDYTKPVKEARSEQRRQSPFTEERIAKTLKTQHKEEVNAEKSQEQTPFKELGSLSGSAASLSDFQSQVHAVQDGEGEIDADSSSVSSSNTIPHQDLLSPSSASSPPTSYSGSPQTKPLSTSPPQTKSSVTTTYKTSSLPTSYPNPESITSQSITDRLFTADDPPLDLLIRTSGVERLSDFMLWQCHEHTRIVFLDVLWPEFDLWQFLPVLWEWQWRGRKEEQRARMLEGRVL